MTLALLALLVASLADVWTTRAGLRAGLVEQNPAMRWATATTRRAVTVKLAGIGLVSLQAALWPSPALVGLLWVGAGGTALLALHNARLLRRLHRAPSASTTPI